MQKYLKSTAMLNYETPELTDLLAARQWKHLDEYDKIGGIYDFVQNEILLGYNAYDNLTATQVLKEGIGQCNTKATLLMALLRAADIPCRLHGARVTKVFQHSLMPNVMAKLAPPFIVHTWAEAFFRGAWVSLEGVITDRLYIAGLHKTFPGRKGKFFDYAVAVKDFNDLQIDWRGKDTAVQQEAVVQDLGVFDTPDEFFADHPQDYRGIKKFFYERFGRKIMTKNAANIRNRARLSES